MSFLRLLLAFVPWITLLIIARDSLLRVKLGLAIALVLSVVMGVARLNRGIILWAGLLFLGAATIAVAGFDHLWTAKHLGVLANGMLSASAWVTVAIGKPFSLDYAREHTDPARWNHPDFIKANVLITSVWATVFTINAILAWGKMTQILLPEWGYDALTYTFLVGAAAFTSWYPSHVRPAGPHGRGHPSLSQGD